MVLRLIKEKQVVRKEDGWNWLRIVIVVADDGLLLSDTTQQIS
jgi:hypothetical protein